MEVITRTVDARGQSCPGPLVTLAKALKDASRGDLLELLATDPGVEPDMKAWSSRTGNELLGIDREGDVFHVFLRRQG